MPNKKFSVYKFLKAYEKSKELADPLKQYFETEPELKSDNTPKADLEKGRSLGEVLWLRTPDGRFYQPLKEFGNDLTAPGEENEKELKMTLIQIANALGSPEKDINGLYIRFPNETSSRKLAFDKKKKSFRTEKSVLIRRNEEDIFTDKNPIYAATKQEKLKEINNVLEKGDTAKIREKFGDEIKELYEQKQACKLSPWQRFSHFFFGGYADKYRSYTEAETDLEIAINEKAVSQAKETAQAYFDSASERERAEAENNVKEVERVLANMPDNAANNLGNVAVPLAEPQRPKNLNSEPASEQDLNKFVGILSGFLEKSDELEEKIPEVLNEVFKDSGKLENQFSYIFIDGVSLESLLGQAHIQQQKANDKSPNFSKWEGNDNYFKAGVTTLKQFLVGGCAVECYPPDSNMKLPETSIRLSPDKTFSLRMPGVKEAIDKERNNSLSSLKNICYFSKAEKSINMSAELFIPADKSKDEISKIIPQTSIANEADPECETLKHYTIAHMLTNDKYKGIPVEDIFDPTKALKEKKEAGAEVLKHIEGDYEGITEDENWLGKLQYDGYSKLLEIVDERTKDVDLSVPEKLFTDKNRCLGAVADIVRKFIDNKGPMKDYLTSIDQYDNSKFDESLESGGFMDEIVNAYKTGKEMALIVHNGDIYQSDPKLFQDALDARVQLKCVGDMSRSKGISFTKASIDTFKAATDSLPDEKRYNDLVKSDPKKAARLISANKFDEFVEKNGDLYKEIHRYEPKVNAIAR